MRTVSQAEGGWTEERLSEERGVQDPELPASSSSIAAERQRNRSAQRRGSNQRGGSVQPHMAPRPVRPAPTLREQERLSCLVELGLLSFGSLAFEIQRRAACTHRVNRMDNVWQRAVGSSHHNHTCCDPSNEE